MERLRPADDFVGFDNYADALSDTVFRGAIGHNLIIVALSIVVQLPLGIGLALLLNRKLRGRACCASWSSRRTCCPRRSPRSSGC